MRIIQNMRKFMRFIGEYSGDSGGGDRGRGWHAGGPARLGQRRGLCPRSRARLDAQETTIAGVFARARMPRSWASSILHR